VWAAQQGQLTDWLDRGVALVERRGYLGGSLGRFGIHSDSLGGSYLECLEAPALPDGLRLLRDDPITCEMETHRHDFPPLELVDRYMRLVGGAIGTIVADQPRSTIHYHTTAQSIRLRDDGTVAVRILPGEGGSDTLIAHSAIVAIGGRQSWKQSVLRAGLTLAQCRPRHVSPSDQLLTWAGLAEANSTLAAADDRPIVVLGGSHSAYAAAWALLCLPAAARLKASQIVIVQRREPRVFYANGAAATEDLYPFAQGDVCPRTLRVNRMGGLRGYGREMWRQISARPGAVREERVVVRSFDDFTTPALRQLIGDAAMVVPCFGYRSSTLPIFDQHGRRLALSADAGDMAVDDLCRLRLADGDCVPNVFGIGLGTGFRLTQSMGGEPNFDGQANSLWLYQNDIGGVIYEAVRALTGKSRVAVAA